MLAGWPSPVSFRLLCASGTAGLGPFGVWSFNIGIGWFDRWLVPHTGSGLLWINDEGHRSYCCFAHQFVRSLMGQLHQLFGSCGSINNAGHRSYYCGLTMPLWVQVGGLTMLATVHITVD